MPDAIAAARQARDALRAQLAPDDARYLDFQLWQEGAARYTEYRIAALAAERFTPSAAIRALPDFKPWDVVRDRIRDGIISGTARASLADNRREVAYPVGAALAMVLDIARPGWRAQYFERPFALPAF